MRMFFLSFLLFSISIFFNYFSGVYATSKAGNSVEDVILSNIPVQPVAFYFVWGAIALIVYVTILLLMHPRRAPFVLCALAMFYFTRAVFISLTHMGGYPDAVTIDKYFFLDKMFGGDDLFFSGHTGAPFMLALVYWREPLMRYIFLLWSLFMGTVVLLGHVHYTIDVLSAFFITFTIYKMTEWLFPRARAVYYSD